MERLNINSDNLSELMFSLHRYYVIADLCYNKNVLDIACGTGYGSYIISNSAKSVIGYDIDAESINIAQKEFIKENLNYVKGNVLKIDLPENTFDFVVSCETIEHLSEKDGNKFLLEIKNVLKKNGILFITTPNKDKTDTFSKKNPFHINEYYSKEFVALLKEHFKNVELYYLDLNVVTIMWNSNKPQKLMTNIKLKNWQVVNNGIDKPIYMAAICSNKSIKKINLSSVLCDNNKILNEKLWNKTNIYEEKIIKLEKQIKKKKIAEEIWKKEKQ